ncbi:enoyl-CoA hydratase/isomerase family protein [Acetobacter orleanensis]|uniref:Enoyl-CoA hydratase n=1 Tax=Acetobacter orleanensis TaxID=104099 RepID=A0A4Y3TLM2_9PROT|nr:enoyl-CoA hydratase/isomerase family protein [Acetobacter orleanensis]KXV65406.1 3-hydroxyisobutyryl-CoA hydrolase [Acetobacter orleanensis]PCD80115.1 enoyl-CoA hydratase/isomerase family protein [Acetobacter orleanensis]GAN68457.1 3-hydroxyisobutyryl-CoA hydrolase/enoyl-CoA hydratase [Acetobacter orleanensis JCM 7639]GBR22818.1 3-hydroxyisobutyryl-CoA hydrolase [Acetobacter orleanensis NRIC 0473]GEB82698.1 enoyl-CoA hydratase [Acetobacter orleanensis]
MIEAALSGTPTVKVERMGPVGRIRLDRPAKLNAVDLEMAEGIARVLEVWRHDPEVTLVLLDSTSPRAFCSGGDLRALSDLVRAEGPEAGVEKITRVYRVMRQIAAYSKPIISLLDGIAMGGGIGLGGHVPYRVVTERSVLAMPETSIGITPDAGGSWILSRMPGLSGLRLALLGERMDGVQAVQNGFADYLIASENLPDLIPQLATKPVKSVLEHYARPVPSAAEHALEGCYSAPDLVQVLRNMDANGSGAAMQDKAALSRLCPFSLQVTWAAWHRARALASLDEAFVQETTLVAHMMHRADFVEGVRAKLIDKDNAPQWQPATLEAVDPEEVNRCFQAL